MQKKVGFQFFNTSAHVYHTAPIAFELSYDKLIKVTLFISSRQVHNTLKNIALSYPGHRCKTILLHPSFVHNLSRKFKKRSHPRVKNVIKHNIKILLKMDALIATDMHLLNYKNSESPLYICTGHGAGDRARGFSSSYTKCDYIFVPGKEKRDRMIKHNIVTRDKIRIIGYPKFDITLQKKKNEFFSNNKPTILYNPHFNSKETSWFKWGNSILNFFKNNKNYNLIFAPHIMLFAKKKNDTISKYKSDNIIIDIDSNSLSDMTYTMAADIYLGDVSSQVYEFVGNNSRPCIFLNTQKANWKNNNNFRMWNMGDVVENLTEFEDTLNNADINFPKYASIQKQYAKKTFSISKKTAGKRGANAIKKILLNNSTNKKPDNNIINL